jgi:hypothetical protein
MPQTTTKLPAGPELEQPGQPRFEIPVTDAPEPPRRRARPPAADAERDASHEPLVIDDRAPKLESWLTVLLVSLALATLALFVPRPARPALFVATGAVMLVGLVMLALEERRSRRLHHRPAEQPTDQPT